jgi:hypothetical protein
MNTRKLDAKSYFSIFPPTFKYQTANELHEYLSTKCKGEYKLLPNIPALSKQHGVTCKITAITSVLNYHYQQKNIEKKPLPIIKEKCATGVACALDAAKLAGSEVGQLYNEKMTRDLIQELGKATKDVDVFNANVVFKRFKAKKKSLPDIKQQNPQQQYIQCIKDIIDEGITPPILFFDVDRRHARNGLPNPDGTGFHEHDAIVIGYIKKHNELLFILGHWEKYFIVNANELALSANNLKDGQQPTRYYYKISGPSTKGHGWFHAESHADMSQYISDDIDRFSAFPFVPDAIHTIANKFYKFHISKKTDLNPIEEKVVIANKSTQKTLTLTCSITPGCLYPVKNDLKNTVCAIVPRRITLLSVLQKPIDTVTQALQSFLLLIKNQPSTLEKLITVHSMWNIPNSYIKLLSTIKNSMQVIKLHFPNNNQPRTNLLFTVSSPQEKRDALVKLNTLYSVFVKTLARATVDLRGSSQQNTCLKDLYSIKEELKKLIDAAEQSFSLNNDTKKLNRL